VALTPAEAVEFFQSYADVGIQYFIVETLDAADTETIDLLAKEVMPYVSMPVGKTSSFVQAPSSRRGHATENTSG
jgi:hypothetical protein